MQVYIMISKHSNSTIKSYEQKKFRPTYSALCYGLAREEDTAVWGVEMRQCPEVSHLIEMLPHPGGLFNMFLNTWNDNNII